MSEGSVGSFSDGEYSVNVGQLLELVEELSAMTVHAARLCEVADESAALFEQSWSGAAYEEYKVAHRRWRRDAVIMRDDVDVLKKHVEKVQHNYGGALGHDGKMWG